MTTFALLNLESVNLEVGGNPWEVVRMLSVFRGDLGAGTPAVLTVQVADLAVLDCWKDTSKLCGPG